MDRAVNRRRLRAPTPSHHGPGGRACRRLSSTSHSSAPQRLSSHHSPDTRHGPALATMGPASPPARRCTGRPATSRTCAGRGGRSRRRARTPPSPGPLRPPGGRRGAEESIEGLEADGVGAMRVEEHGHAEIAGAHHSDDARDGLGQRARARPRLALQRLLRCEHAHRLGAEHERRHRARGRRGRQGGAEHGHHRARLARGHGRDEGAAHLAPRPARGRHAARPLEEVGGQRLGLEPRADAVGQLGEEARRAARDCPPPSPAPASPRSGAAGARARAGAGLLRARAPGAAAPRRRAARRARARGSAASSPRVRSPQRSSRRAISTGRPSSASGAGAR